jgi:lipopolysaccharide export system protein LptA
MDRAFQFSLRAALVLCILAGVGIIVYSVASPGPRYRRAENQPASPDSGVPTAEAQAAAPSPAGTAAGPGASAAPKEAEMQFAKWMQHLTDPKTQREEGVISGLKAIVRGDNLVDVVAPLVVATMPAQDTQDVDVQLGQVRITAENGNVDKDKGLVRLFNNVQTEGKDFVVRADHILYSVGERTLTSDGPVEIQKDNLAADGTRTPAMTLNGQGLAVNMTLQTMKVNSGATAHVYGVSPEFLAAGPQASGLPLQPTDVVITSDGPMLYEHLARRVTFTRNVKAVYGVRTLTCDELTIQLAAAEGKGPPKVSDIFAQGNVALSFEDQVARGQSLEWHSVTQTGTLVGEPCEVVASAFRLTGDRLTFYQMNTRFHSKGPGKLFWGGGAPQAAGAASPPAGKPAAAIPQVGILNLNKDNPVTISWQTSMSYDVAARPSYATFAGNVVAQQADSALSCDQLALNFQPDTTDIDSVVATGNVSVRDQRTANAQDITCQELTWKAQADTIELTAARGQTVAITQGRQKISSSHMVFDNRQGILDCPAPGRLTMEPTRQPAAGAAAPPIAVDWQTSMRFVQRPAPFATFAGSALAQRGDESLKADSLRIDFDAQMNPLKITAQGGALIDVRSSGALSAAPMAPAGQPPAPGVENHWRLAGESVTIEAPQQVMWSDTPGTLTVMQNGTTAGTIAWQKQVRLDSREGTAHFEGGVAADTTGGTLKCDDLTARFDENQQLRHAWAQGNVEFEATGANPWKLKSATAEAVFVEGSQLRQVIARGDDAAKVRVADANRVLDSRRLTLSLDAAEGEAMPTISRAIAEEDVVLTYNVDPIVQAMGDRLEWDRATDTYVLTGEPRARVRRGSMVTSSSRIVLNRLTGRDVGNPTP